MSRFRFVQAALALLIALVATFSALPPRIASAATSITDCSDPDAIEALLELGGDFVFDCGTVTITFNSQIDVHDDLSIEGSDTTTFTIAGASQIFVLDEGIGLALTRLTVSGSGVAIANSGGVVTLSNSTFTNNGTVLHSSGGSVYVESSSFSGSTNGALRIYATDTFTVADSTFTSNSEPTAGGAIYFAGDGQLGYEFSISGGSFTNNHSRDGGAILIDNDFSQSPLSDPQYTHGTIDGVSFSGNSADEGGGAISNRRGDLIVRNSTFNDNTAGFGGAIYNTATQLVPGEPVWDPNRLAISTSTFEGNFAPYGGGVTSNGTLSIERSTLLANVGGGLLLNGGSASVTNSTFSFNGRAVRNGDGNGNRGAALTISSTTFSNNGPAVTIETAAGTTSISNSIIDSSSTSGACSGRNASGGHNIVSDDTCFLPSTGDLFDTTPLLGPLANNGGPTRTVALLSGSPAIDAGACPGVTTDQRGVMRPQGAACDIGAVEDDFSAPNTTIVDPPAITNGSGGPFTFSSSEPEGTFQCKIDSGSFSPCTSPASFPGLSEGTHALQVQATDPAGLVDPTPASHTWIVDLTAPVTTLLTQPPALSGSPAASFTFVGSDLFGISGFECQVDSTGFAACASPAEYADLSDDTHTFQVRAIDAVGNADATPASYTWTIDVTGPDTTMLTTPASIEGSSSATFTFSGDDPNGIASFECDLDSAGFGSCTSPLDLSDLSDGSHTVQVRAIDTAGNVDPSPASYTWTVDTSAPDTSILSTPASVSNVTAPTFTFDGSDANSIAGFECALDGDTFTDCVSPTDLSGLSEGSHTFQVHANDAAGNSDPSPATFTWTIDLTPPDTTLLTQPAPISNDTSPAFTFSGSDTNGVAGFECRVDGDDFTACTSPRALSRLANGAHTFAVRAIDNAGNVDATPVTYSWTVEATGPDTTILTTPLAIDGSASATFSFTGDDFNGKPSFECALDDGDFTGCTSPLELTGLGDGAHTLQVRAIDDAGNADPTPASYTWTVDTTPPDTTLLTMPPSVSNSTAPSFTFEGSDANGIASFECALDGGVFEDCTSPLNRTGLSHGAHTFEVRATDNAGRVDPSPANYTWTVDLTPPDTTLLSTPAALSRNVAPAFTFSGNDANGIASYECKLDSADFSPCTSPAPVSGLSDGTHTFAVRAIDAAGNVDTSPATHTWVVDTTAPLSGSTLSGSKSGDWYSDAATLTLSASDSNGIASIRYKIDAGTLQTYSVPFSVTGNGPHTIAYYAVDAAGNIEATRTIAIRIDATAPLVTITLPNGGAPLALNSLGIVTYNCSDPNGSGIASCTGSPTSGGALDTSSPGSRSITVTATDRVGKSTTQTVSYQVGYTFALRGDVSLGRMNQVIAGDRITLQFTLGGNVGLGVFQTGFPKLQPISCTTGAALGSPVTLPLVSGLQYRFNSYYELTWKSQASWAGTCRQVVLNFNDGSTYRLNYSFRNPGW